MPTGCCPWPPPICTASSCALSQGSAILCTAMLVKPGRALSVWRAEMTNEDSDKLVATATATFYLPA